MWTLSPVEFADLPGWRLDNHHDALTAFSKQRFKPEDERYRIGRLGIDPDWFQNAVELAQSELAKAEPRQFFENNFLAYHLSDGQQFSGKVTGFYEPEVRASLVRDGRFQTPILRRPQDLIAVNDENRPSELDKTYRFGRMTRSGKVAEYFDRAQIQAGALDTQNLAIAFVEDPVDAFFIHIQGAARLILEGGEILRITYNGKSGHPFTPIGRLLVERGEISRSDISMQSIRRWLSDYPDKARGLMEENRSYIFFKTVKHDGKDDGPIAAAKVPLTAGRSLAVDRLVHTFSTPVFVNAERVNGRAFDRLMIAQETGTAIVGAARGDIFFGSGQEAGELAGAVNSPCAFTILVPKGAPFDHTRVRLSDRALDR